MLFFPVCLTKWNFPYIPSWLQCICLCRDIRLSEVSVHLKRICCYACRQQTCIMAERNEQPDWRRKAIWNTWKRETIKMSPNSICFSVFYHFCQKIGWYIIIIIYFNVSLLLPSTLRLSTTRPLVTKCQRFDPSNLTHNWLLTNV